MDIGICYKDPQLSCGQCRSSLHSISGYPLIQDASPLNPKQGNLSPPHSIPASTTRSVTNIGRSNSSRGSNQSSNPSGSKCYNRHRSNRDQQSQVSHPHPDEEGYLPIIHRRRRSYPRNSPTHESSSHYWERRISDERRREERDEVAELERLAQEVDKPNPNRAPSSISQEWARRASVERRQDLQEQADQELADNTLFDQVFNLSPSIVLREQSIPRNQAAPSVSTSTPDKHNAAKLFIHLLPPDIVVADLLRRLLNCLLPQPLPTNTEPYTFLYSLTLICPICFLPPLYTIILTLLLNQ